MEQDRTEEEGQANEKLGMYFLSLELENLKVFGTRQTIDFSHKREGQRPARWTIILGENGTGKTTVLRVLKSMTFVREGNESPIVMDLWDQIEFYIKDVQRRPSKPRIANIQFSIQSNIVNDTHECFEIRSKSSNIDINSSLTGNWQPFFSSAIGTLGYGATRLTSFTKLTTDPYFDELSTLMDETVPLRNPEEWFLQMDYLSEKNPDDPRYRNYRDKVLAILIDLLPDVKQIRFATKDTFRISAQFETAYGWVAIQDLSLGYQSFIGWMVDLASRMFERYPDEPDPLAMPAVVLVDEIDLHMHPKWQREIIGVLTEKFPNTQFIVTAHSPLVVQSAPDANIVLLKREGDEVRVHQDLDVVKNWRIDQILTSELFGLDSARPPEQAKLMEERNALLAKVNPTEEESERIEQLKYKMGDVNYGENPSEMRAEDLLWRLTERLKREQEGDGKN